MVPKLSPLILKGINIPEVGESETMGNQTPIPEPVPALWREGQIRLQRANPLPKCNSLSLHSTPSPRANTATTPFYTAPDMASGMDEA